MNRIDPDRLTRLRTARKLSQQGLAQVSHVSARQITRLEAAEEAINVRAATISRLASALKVTSDVLAGRAPLPENLDLPDQEPPEVLPEALAELRRRRGWPRSQLAEKAGISPQLIERIERSAKPYKVKPRNLKRLARALAVEEAVLRGSATLPPDPPTPQQKSVTVQSSPGLRLAYELVERRYGATAKDLFTLAPMLFVLLAEGSLDRRRAKLQQARQALQDLDKLGRDHPTLYFAQDVYQQAFDEGARGEEMSIESSDVRGLQVWDDSAADMHGFTEDDMTVTPFADYLEELANAVDKPELIHFRSWPPSGLPLGEGIWGANPYSVCQGDLHEIAGDSEAARWALEWGEVRISDIPTGLMSKDAKSDRAAWLESRLSDDVRAEAERLQKAWDDTMHSISLALGGAKHERD